MNARREPISASRAFRTIGPCSQAEKAGGFLFLSKQILLDPVTSEDENCLRLLAEFLRSRRHIALVRDEKARLTGLVTVEGFTETLLGG